MANLLGDQPERFAPRAALSAAHAGQFFVLEHDASTPRAAAVAATATAAAPPPAG